MITDIQLDEIQQVYFGLKTDDVTYVSQSIGNDGNSGLSVNNPKKTLISYPTKYIFILDGIFNRSDLLLGEGKIILGLNINVTKIIVNTGYNKALNISGKYYNLNIESSSRGITGTFYATNCCIGLGGDYYGVVGYNSDFYNLNSVSGGKPTISGYNNTTRNGNESISSQNLDITNSQNSIFINDKTITLNEDNIDSRLINHGLDSLLNPDGTRSNIGITGGPYYFNGFKKNLSGSNIDITIDTINNIMNFGLNQLNINPIIPNITNGIVQKIYKTTDTEVLHLLDKTIDVQTGQVKSTTIPFE